MLDDQIFQTVVDSAPLVSIDILIKKDNKILLGKRINKPAQGYFFSTGGRINKNETIDNAMARVALNELNIELNLYQSLLACLSIFMMTVFIKTYQRIM